MRGGWEGWGGRATGPPADDGQRPIIRNYAHQCGSGRCRKARKSADEITATLTDPGAIAQLSLQPLCDCKPDDKVCSAGRLMPHEKHALVAKARKMHAEITGRKHTQVLTKALAANAKLEKGECSFPGVFFLAGHGLCVNAYKLAMGWSRRVWYEARRAVITAYVENPDANVVVLDGDDDNGVSAVYRNFTRYSNHRSHRVVGDAPG
jgi:hypothetical protein